MSEIVMAERISALMLTSWIAFRSNEDERSSTVAADVRRRTNVACFRLLTSAATGGNFTAKNLATGRIDSYRHTP